MNAPAQANSITLGSLRWSLLLLVTTALVCAAIVAGILHFRQTIDRGHAQAVAQQNEARARLARANDDEREIRAKIARYQDLIRLGRTDSEKRLEWVETLGNIKTTRRLLGLDYEIAPQRPLDEKNPVTGGHAFLVSPMRLDMPLLHEGDLLGLLADLSAQVHALVSVRSCKISRLSGNAAGQAEANLRAACEIDWITLQEKT